MPANHANHDTADSKHRRQDILFCKESVIFRYTYKRERKEEDNRGNRGE